MLWGLCISTSYHPSKYFSSKDLLTSLHMEHNIVQMSTTTFLSWEQSKCLIFHKSVECHKLCGLWGPLSCVAYSHLASSLETLTRKTSTRSNLMRPVHFTYMWDDIAHKSLFFSFFLLENALKKLLNTFPNFFFYLKVQSFWVIMENNFSQMAA